MTWRFEDIKEGDSLLCIRKLGTWFVVGEAYPVMSDGWTLEVEGEGQRRAALHLLNLSYKYCFEHIFLQLENE